MADQPESARPAAEAKDGGGKVPSANGGWPPFDNNGDNPQQQFYCRKASFQFHQIPLVQSPRRGGRRSQEHFCQHHTFLQRFRSHSNLSDPSPSSQCSSPSCISKSSGDGTGNLHAHTSATNLVHNNSNNNYNNNNNNNVTTASSSTANASNNGQGEAESSQGPRHPKPKKWFSFTNLLNRHNLANLINLPKSRLSVSSTLNSVFVGGNPNLSPGDQQPFFAGLANLGYSCQEEGPGSGYCVTSHNPNPKSPSHSSCSVPADYLSKLGDLNPSGSGQSVFPVDYLSKLGDLAANSGGPGQVVYRRKSGRSGGSSSVASTGSNSGQFHWGSKHHPSSSGTNSESDRSSGVGYFTGNSYSSASSCAGGFPTGTGSTGYGGSASGSGGSSRLSCGEFFTGTPNSPICSGSEFHFGGGGNSGGGLSVGKGALDGGSLSSTAAAVYNHQKNIGRSLPTLLESMEPCSSSCDGDSKVSVDAVVDLMYQEFAVLTGAKTLDDHYILTFPDRGNFHLITEDDYRRLMLYLTSVPPMHDVESGFVIIVDRRNDKWNSVKTTLVRISNYFPGLIHRVFVLRPVGLFQKALSEISSKLFRSENLRFRLTVCNNVADLLTYVDSSQLTIDLGGNLVYDKVKWVQQRVEVEAFHQALLSLSKDLKSFTEGFQDLEYPNDVSSTELLISDKQSDYHRLKCDLTQAVEHGENLLCRIKGSPPPVSLSKIDQDLEIPSEKSLKNGTGKIAKSTHNTQNNSWVQLINVISVERYIIQIEETARLFNIFWTKEKSSLDQCLMLRKFEQDFKEMQMIFDANIKRIREIGEMGEGLNATEMLLSETLAFEASSSTDVVRSKQLQDIGQKILENNQAAVDIVEPKCLELSRMTDQFCSLLNHKISKQKQWQEIQAVIEKANLLCNEGMDLMTCQVTDFSEDTTDGLSWTDSISNKIDNFLGRLRKVAEELNILKSNMASPTHSQSKPLVKQVLKRVEDVETMCVKRKSAILQQINSKAVKSRRSSGSSFASTPSSSSQNAYSSSGSELKSAKSTSQLDSNMDDYSPGLRSGSSSLSLDGNMRAPKIMQRENDWERQVKRGHILNELMETEKSYVNEIGEILTEYRDQLSNLEVREMLPDQLKPIITSTKLQRKSPNVAVLFCNLDEIFAFHSKLFLPDLNNCVESVELLGLCFIQRHSDFLTLYSQYCQLLPASEALRKEIGENHPWFVACRNRLGHKLPLGAYLLKPVQRITKYHLLLKDLVKNSEDCEGHAELVEALECMLVVLRCVNDGMHQLGITGYPEKLIEEGYLLLQGSFLMWTENRKDRLRLKGHQRHLFLYQKSLLICKKVPKSTLYEFRNKLSLSEIGLTEVLKGSGAAKKFEVWVNGRQKVFLFQAETAEVKNLWVTEIKKLLYEQLESIRTAKSQTISACNNSGVASYSNLSSASSAALRRQKMLNRGIALNGWRPANLSHRPLRQVSSWDNPETRPKSRSTDEMDDEFWSSEVSNSDEEDSLATPSRPLSFQEDSCTPNFLGSCDEGDTKESYLALANYVAAGPSEVSLKEGDIVTLLKVGYGGWWFIRTHGEAGEGCQEGWAPSAFLDKVSKASKEFSVSVAQEISYGRSREAKLTNTQSTKDLMNIQSMGSHFPGRSASIPNPNNKSSSPFLPNSKISQSTDDILSALR